MNINQIIEHFHFLRPLFLFALPLLFGIAHLLLHNKNTGHAQSELVAPHLACALIIPARTSRIFNPANTALLAACLTALALAGPTWQQQVSPLTEDEAVLIIALDVSRSMQQADVQPSRLERAKQKIQDLLALRAGARSGLIVFSGSAHSVLPPTNDVDLLTHFLDSVQADIMPRQGKAAGKIVPITEAMLKEAVAGRSDIPGTVLLLTDQLDESAHNTLSQSFKSMPHQLLVWGIGLVDSTSKKGAADGALASAPNSYSPLNEDSLKKLANATDGYYQAMSTDKSDVHRINWRIENHLLFVDDEERPWRDMGYYLIWPILLLSLLFFRKGWSVSSTELSSTGYTHQHSLLFALAAVLPLLISPLSEAQPEGATRTEGETPASIETNFSFSQWFIDQWFTRDQQARYFFEQGLYSKAARLYQQPMSRAIAHYLAEEFDAAAEVFSSLNSDTALFNQANALAHGRHYVGAVNAYTQLLNSAPNYPGASKNRAIVQALIDANNQMSESQQAEAGELELAQELGEQAQSGDGAEQISWQEQQRYSAEQILTDERIQQQWMKQVQQNPSRFLAVKFQMQANNQQVTDAATRKAGATNE